MEEASASASTSASHVHSETPRVRRPSQLPSRRGSITGRGTSTHTPESASHVTTAPMTPAVLADTMEKEQELVVNKLIRRLSELRSLAALLSAAPTTNSTVELTSEVDQPHWQRALAEAQHEHEMLTQRLAKLEHQVRNLAAAASDSIDDHRGKKEGNT